MDKGGKTVTTAINAKAETVDTLRSFSGAFKKRRCLIPADGFYEGFEGPPGAKAPMFISLKSGDTFAMAGLWNSWRSSEGDPVLSCTIITATSQHNEVVEPLHDRMPVMLPQDAQDMWMDHSHEGTAVLKEFLVPYPGKAMTAYRVRPLRSNGPECIEPLE